jgi:4-amino-4-deoxy-L-arabinose transferase-like glycosyltransferase
MDQSIVFDGGWRILQGQVPYRDFVLPFGPVSMWLQAAAFRILGVSYFAVVLPACLMNALGACLAYSVFRKLSPEKIWPALAAGLVTGSWLYAPMGTVYLEQTAFVGIWIAQAMVVFGIDSPRFPVQTAWMAGAGLALSAALFSKTNAGGLAIPFVFLTAVLLPPPERRRWLAPGVALSLGLAAGLGLFFLWLAAFSDLSGFRNMVLGAGGHEGRKRLLENKEMIYVMSSLLTGKGNDLIRILQVAFYTLLGLGLALAAGPGRNTGAAAYIRPLGWLGILWIAYQLAFGVTSNNNGINEQPFLGLVLVCTILLALRLPEMTRQMVNASSLDHFRKRAGWLLGLAAMVFTLWMYIRGIRGMGNFNFAFGVLLALGAFLAKTSPQKSGPYFPRASAWIATGILTAVWAIGAWGSYFRQAQDFFNFHTRYVRGEGIPSLQGLAWAEGVNADALPMHPSWTELVEIWKLLDGTPGRFHLLGNYTLLYALTERPNPGPVSYFYRGLTLPDPYDAKFDADFAARIDHPDVIYFILEEPAKTNGLLGSLPRLCEVLETKYRFFRKIGIFQVYRRIEAPEPAGR